MSSSEGVASKCSMVSSAGAWSETDGRVELESVEDVLMNVVDWSDARAQLQFMLVSALLNSAELQRTVPVPNSLKQTRTWSSLASHTKPRVPCSSTLPLFLEEPPHLHQQTCREALSHKLVGAAAHLARSVWRSFSIAHPVSISLSITPCEHPLIHSKATYY